MTPENKITNIDENDIINTEVNEPKNENIEKKRNTISKNIHKIIENKDNPEYKETDEFKKISKFINRSFKLYLSKLDNKDEISFLDKFTNEEGVNHKLFDKKMDKYFPIHSDVFFENLIFFINLNLRNKKDLSEEKTNIINKNSINNFIEKYSYIIFIFGEKIKLSDLNKLLKLDITTISQIYNSVSKTVENIHNKELKNIDDLKKLSLNKKNIETCEIINEQFLDSTYRNVFRKVALENTNLEIGKIFNKVSLEINKLYKEEMNNFYKVFEKWKDSDGLEGENLVNLENTAKKILYSIDILKSSNVAFNYDIYSNHNQKNFINEVIDFLIPKVEQIKKKEFLDFLNIAFKEKGEEKYTDFIEKIREQKNKQAESKVPKELENPSEVDLEKIDFNDWSNLIESNKYDHLFNGIISKNGNLNLDLNLLELDKIDDEKVSIFCNSFLVEEKKGKKVYGIDKNTVINQFNHIKLLNKKNTTLEDFIKEDINNFNLIVIWWNYILKTRQIKNENNELNEENIQNIIERPYGTIEKISQGLKEKGIFESKKIGFNPDGRLVNTSVDNIQEHLNTVIKGFKKGPIDIEETNIESEEGNKLPIKDLTDLYIPLGISDSDNSLSIEEQKNSINNWMCDGIDLCYKILQKRNHLTKGQKEYLTVLQTYKILPNDITTLSNEQLGKIQDLVEYLKVIKNKRKKLSKMIDIAKNDKKSLEAELQELFITEEKNTMESGFGPTKSFTRAFKKLIKDYKGDFTELGDLTRLRIVRKDLNSSTDTVVQFIEKANNSNNIKHISIVDTTGEAISNPSKLSGYRDKKLLFTVESGNVVELQFQYDRMLEYKEKGIDLIQNRAIINKIKSEGKLFTEDDLRELFNLAKKKNMVLPNKELLNDLLSIGNIDSLIYETGINEELFQREKISTDYTYDITREMGKNSEARKKITRIERAIADQAWSEIVLDHLKSKNVKVN